jgi:hypothetical protein
MEQDNRKLVGLRWQVDVAIVCRWEGRAEEKGVSDPQKRKSMVVMMASGKEWQVDSAAMMRFVGDGRGVESNRAVFASIKISGQQRA